MKFGRVTDMDGTIYSIYPLGLHIEDDVVHADDHATMQACSFYQILRICGHYETLKLFFERIDPIKAS